MPERPDHPDHERLAAYEAGDGDRRERAGVEAHLAGCPSCAEVVASVERARGRLALLEEPDLPSGLHDRLAAAVEAEASRPGRQGAEEPRDRRAPWFRRPVAWGAAAALLLAALVVPFLDQSGGDLTTAGGGGGGADTAQEAAGAGSVPVFSVPGEVSAATVSSRLATDARAKAALDSAAAGTRGGRAATDSQVAPGAPQFTPDSGGPRPSATAPQAGPADLEACLPTATATADPATRPLVPAFYLEGTYQGRAATVLVTTSNGEPGRVDLWVFPRNDCSSPPLAAERVR